MWKETSLFDLNCPGLTFEPPKQVKLVGCVLKALRLSTFTYIQLFQKKKKAQLVTGWPGFSLHFKEMT